MSNACMTLAQNGSSRHSPAISAQALLFAGMVDLSRRILCAPRLAPSRRARRRHVPFPMGRVGPSFYGWRHEAVVLVKP